MEVSARIFSLTKALTFLFLLLKPCLSNQYDPHVFPEQGPFVEGWYARIMDSNHSFGVLFGRVQPAQDGTSRIEGSKYHPNMLSFIHSRGDNSSMESFQVFPALEDIDVSVRGGPVTANPDDASPADFEWNIKPYGYFKTTPNRTIFNFTNVQGISFSGELGPPCPWGPNGEGPEGWLDHVPFLPLHWFVYSLGSKVLRYQWSNAKTAEVISGQSGLAHQEKNWGKGFPPAWIWAEGVHGPSGSSFAVSLGVLDIAKVDIPAHLIGYRSPIVNLDFRPTNSILKKSIDGCGGRVNATVTSLLHQVVIDISAAPSTLQTCLLGPTEVGFVPVCVESYTALATFKVYKLTTSGYTLVDKRVFTGAALEFGGLYLCKVHNPCPELRI